MEAQEGGLKLAVGVGVRYGTWRRHLKQQQMVLLVTMATRLQTGSMLPTGDRAVWPGSLTGSAEAGPTQGGAAQLSAGGISHLSLLQTQSL